MERIKDLSKVILRGDYLLAEVVEDMTDSGIIIPDTVKNGFDYLRVLAVGRTINDIEPGFILLDVAGNVDVYPVNGMKVAMMPRHNVLISVIPENFDPSMKKRRTSKTDVPKIHLAN